MTHQHDVDTDQTLERIDAVLADGYEVAPDWEVGPDAVRSRPADREYAEGGFTEPESARVPITAADLDRLQPQSDLAVAWGRFTSSLLHALRIPAIVEWLTHLLRRRRKRTGSVIVIVTPDFDNLERAFHPIVLMARNVEDRHAIRQHAARERRELAAWWDDHLDHVYADLGLERPR